MSTATQGCSHPGMSISASSSDNIKSFFRLCSVSGPLLFGFGVCGLSFLSADVRNKCLAQTSCAEDFLADQLLRLPAVPLLFIQSRYDATQVNHYNN